MNKQQELEERARVFYNSGAYDGDYDFSLSSACQFAAAFLIHDSAACSQMVAPPLMFDEFWAATNNSNYFSIRTIDVATLKQVASEAWNAVIAHSNAALSTPRCPTDYVRVITRNEEPYYIEILVGSDWRKIRETNSTLEIDNLHHILKQFVAQFFHPSPLTKE